ncbi:HvfC/BufC N-terminal domain-containing protein [Bdellovibrio svalbardensis]|uniref:DNA-binding domain-containing protein n=1 Tax=Bdellovibrio svalbardensis TaxID=2972972 RepID=A0ABT6DFN3_9BACT|nr:DNA-binding domain-containing protein [Bdellovibrio svalbardensis]MDG0815637.1 DNA-binding domain-containing protein [Bdellovibrio svalbardensis]
MKLQEVQSLFKKQTLFPGEADPEVLKTFKPGGQLKLKEAFEVYHKAYIARLTEALDETFEGVHWVLGDHIFQEVCQNYIDTQPSTSYNLSDYGASFPDFIRLHPAIKGIPFVFDLARFEWRFKNIFHAPSPDPLTVERIQELMNEDDFKVSFVEAMELFESPYAIYDIWTRRKEPQYEFENIDWELPENLLLYKKDKKIYVKKIANEEFRILKELRDGKSVSAALAEQPTSMSPDKISQLFQMMMRAGIIDDITPL